MSMPGETPSSRTNPLGQEPHLPRALRTVSIIFMVVAAVAPLGAASVVLPTIFAASENPVSPLYIVGAGVILCVFAVGFTQMGRNVRNAGAFYTYIQAGLGRSAGAAAASLALASYVALLVAIYAYFGFFAAVLLEGYAGVSAPWWILSLMCIALVGALGYHDVDLSAKVLGGLLVLEILVIVTVDVAIIARGGASGLSAAPLDVSQAFEGAPGLGLMFAFFAFVGFEATAVFRSEAFDPDRTIPRATYGAILLIVLLYGVTSWAQAVGVGTDRVVGEATSNPAGFMLSLSYTYVGQAFQHVFQVLLLTSVIACLLSFHNVVTRYQFNLAHGGLLPRRLGRVNSKHHAPSNSSIVVTTVCVAILGSLAMLGLEPVAEIYTWLSGSGTLGVIILMALTSLAVVVYFRRRGNRGPVWKVVIAPVLSLAGLSCVAYLAINNLPLLLGGRSVGVVVCAAITACLVVGAVVSAIRRSPDRPAVVTARSDSTPPASTGCNDGSSQRRRSAD